MISTLLVIALIGQCLTFIGYGTDVCAAKNGSPYHCNAGLGTGWSMLAFIFYLVTSLLLCCSPQATPFVMAQMAKKKDKENKTTNDGCFYCCKKEEEEEEEEEERPTDGMELTGGDEEEANAAAAVAAGAGGAQRTAGGVAPIAVDDEGKKLVFIQKLTFGVTMTGDPDKTCVITLMYLKGKTLQDLVDKVRAHPVGKAFFRLDAETAHAFREGHKYLLLKIETDSYRLHVYQNDQFENFDLLSIAHEIYSKEKDLAAIPAIFSIEDSAEVAPDTEDIFEPLPPPPPVVAPSEPEGGADESQKSGKVKSSLTRLLGGKQKKKEDQE